MSNSPNSDISPIETLHVTPIDIPVDIPVDDDEYGDFDEYKQLPPPTISIPELLSTAFPISHSINYSNSNSGNLIHFYSSQNSPNTQFHNLFSRLSKDTVFSEHGSRFGWRRSLLRKMFLQSLNVELLDASKSKLELPMTLKHNPFKNMDQKVGDNSSSQTFGKITLATTDSRELDLTESKRLCEITEEDLRKQSPEELLLLLKSLDLQNQKMHQQANYWLDQKEQLIMDAETHNKVIGSLIQYAKQQQTAPKVAINKSSHAKKKRVGH